MKNGREGVYFVATLEAEWNLEDILPDTIVVCRRLGRKYDTLKKALPIREQKRWQKSVEEHRATIEAIEHVHFVYASLESVPETAQPALVKAIADQHVRFPLPTVTVWSSSDLDMLLRKLATGGESES